MAQITNNGRLLASKLNPALGTTREILETCSLIARHAATHNALQVAKCNVPFTIWHEKRERDIERRISELVDSLPLADGERIKLALGGDPRGWTVKLVMPGEWSRLHDDWGREGICVEVK